MKGKFTKIKMQKLVMPFSASSTIKKKKKIASRETNSSIAFVNAVLECYMPARLASQACHYAKMNCRVKR